MAGRSHRHVTALTAVFVGVLLLAGCATPDLRPFADASKMLSASVRAGGNLAINPLARQPLWDGSRFVPPEDPAHPARTLAASWELRRRTADAVLVYSASLASIGDAAAAGRQNAAALVGSVKQLAAAVPTLSTGVSAAGDLVVFGLQTYIEVKAFRDMRRAVQAADPAIQLVATAFEADLADLAKAFESTQRDQMIQKTAALRPLERLHAALQQERLARREAVANAPADGALGVELARLDALVAAVEPDLGKVRADRAAAEERLENGREFFTAAMTVVRTWAQAHGDLVQSFDRRRSPNLVLLTARAEELAAIVNNLRTLNRTGP